MEYKDTKELDTGIILGGLFDFLDKLTDLFDEYCVDEVSKCNDGIIIKTDDGEIVFENYDTGVFNKLKIQNTYDTYYRYGDPYDDAPRPRVLNKTQEEQEKNNEMIRQWYSGNDYYDTDDEE